MGKNKRIRRENKIHNEIIGSHVTVAAFYYWLTMYWNQMTIPQNRAMRIIVKKLLYENQGNVE